MKRKKYKLLRLALAPPLIVLLVLGIGCRESSAEKAQAPTYPSLWESFDQDFNPNLNQALLKELASCSFIEEKVAILIVGPCGTGKSHIAQAIGHAAVRQGHDVLFKSQLLCQLS